jgi:hypothetical protein
MPDLAIEKKEQPDALMTFIERASCDPSFDVQKLKELFALRDREMARVAEQEFNLAMNAAQNEISRVAPNAENTETHSKYATYARLDKILRPIYIRHGFSLSFNSAEPIVPEMLPVMCFVSHSGGHTRTYRMDMPADGRGPKGGAVMTRTHATGSAMQYGMRYLLKSIFNIAIGVDDDGNAATGGQVDPNRLAEHCEWMASAKDMEELRKLFTNAYREATEAGDKQAQNAYIAAKNKRRKEIE